MLTGQIAILLVYTRPIVYINEEIKMAQTLEELKAENAAKEAEALENTETQEVETTEVEVEEETQETQEVAEQNEEEGEAETIEAWMQTEEQTSDGNEKEFTHGDIAKAKSKLKAKLQAEKDENAELKERIKALESQQGQVKTVQTNGKRPRLADFDFDQDAYDDAMDRWYDEKLASNQKQSVAAESQKRAAAQLNQAVDQHYQRAQVLADENNINPETYQNADLAVRTAVDSVLPGSGDSVTDGIIARLGEGSEKVMYFLGQNPSERAKFVEKLKDDKTGIAASIMLGEIKSKITAPVNRVSTARKPATTLSGDGGGEVSSKLKRQYEKASGNSAADLQTRIDLKRKAKAEGVDVSNW